MKGQRELMRAFQKYCEVETLDGDNKYQAEGYGLQDATKGKPRAVSGEVDFRAIL